MKRSIAAIAVILLLTGCLNQREDLKSMNQEGVIFVALPSEDNDYYQPFYEDIIVFHEQFESKTSKDDSVISLTYQETGYDDIWIRDIAPVATTRLVKFVYSPEYLSEKISSSLDNSLNDWLFDHQFEVYYSPLVLDGGNLIWNKKDTVILTTRILEDNPDLGREEIMEQLKTDLNVNIVIFIPPEPGDVLAHADGMVKFIDDTTLFISDFLGDAAFRQQIEAIILDQMPDAQFVIMPSAYTEQGQYDDDIASAKGLYINIMETESAWYVPQFQLQQDEEMLEFVKSYTDKQVIPLEIESLSTMGGAINCLTWYCPSKFLPPQFYE